MKHPYNIKIIASILLFSHALMSCYNPSLSEKKHNIAINPQKPLSNQSAKTTKATEVFLANGKTICFQRITGNWQAIIQNAGDIHVLPVFFAPGYNLEEIVALNPAVYSQLIHFVSRETNPQAQPYIFIGEHIALAKHLEAQTYLKQEVSGSEHSTKNPNSSCLQEENLASKQHETATMFTDTDMWHPSAVYPRQTSISSAASELPAPIESSQAAKAKQPTIAMEASISAQSFMENPLKHKKITLPITNTANREMTFIAKGGHRLTLHPQGNRWRGKVNENLPIGFSRQLSLPVYGNSALLAKATLATQSQGWYKQHIHVIFPEQDHKNHQGFIYVGKLGLMGGDGIGGQPESKEAANLLIENSSKQQATCNSLWAGMCSVARTIVHNFKEVCNYAKEALVSKAYKVAKLFYNHILKPVAKFAWIHGKAIVLCIGGAGILALVAIYPGAGIMLLQGDATVLFASQGFGAAIAGWGASLGIAKFFDSLLWNQKENSAKNKSLRPAFKYAVSENGATSPSITTQQVASQAPVLSHSRHQATWKENYTSLKSYITNFTQPITDRLATFKSFLLEKAKNLGYWFRWQTSSKKTTAPCPGPTLVSPSFADPIPAPSKQARKASTTVFSKPITNNRPKALPANNYKPPKASNDRQQPKQPKQLQETQVALQGKANTEQKEEGASATVAEEVAEGIRLENLEEAKVVVEGYLKNLRQSAPSQQTELYQKGKELLSSVENLKKITKEQYRSIGRSFILADVEEHSWLLLLEQEKALKYKYRDFKALRNQLQAAIPLSKAALRACGLRIRYNPATEQEDFYSSDEGQNYSDQSIRIKQAVGAGIGSALKNHVQIMLPSLLRLALDPKGTLQSYIDLLASIPDLPELLKEYYNAFYGLSEEERAEGLGQLLTELLLTLTPTRKLHVGQIASLKSKLGKAADKVALTRQWPATLEKIFRPNGVLIGNQVKNKRTSRNVTPKEGNYIIDQLMAAGATKVTPPVTYTKKGKQSTWYRLPDGRQFGVSKTNSMLFTRHNVQWTIDIKQLDIGLESVIF
jgi:hypothetical protein